MDVRQRTRIFAFFALLLCLVQLFPLEAQGQDVRLKIIVVSSRDEAEELLRLAKAGADFGELAKSKSIDASAAAGGDLGTVNPNDLRTELRDAVVALKTGGLTGIVSIPSGFAILKVGGAATPNQGASAGISKGANENDRRPGYFEGGAPNQSLSGSGGVRFTPNVGGAAEAETALNAAIKTPGFEHDLRALCTYRTQSLARNIDWLSETLAPENAEQLRSVPPLDQVQMRYALAQLAAYRGDMDLAIKEFEPLYLAAKAGHPNYAVIFGESLAATSMHAAEMKNGIYDSPTDRCLVSSNIDTPLANPALLDKSISVYLELLERNPADTEARWALNTAYLIAGKYPSGVPAKYLIPSSKFASAYSVGRFKDVAQKSGLNLVSMAGGIIVDDFDGDGLLDVVTSSMNFCEHLHFFHNNGDGTFTDRSENAGLMDQLGGLNINQADYDNDGCTDILVMRGGWEFPMRRSLLKNDCHGHFTDVTQSAGLENPLAASQTAVWVDLDNDGYLDLFIGNERGPSQLFHNKGNGTFEEIGAKAGVDRQTFAKAVAAGDYDNDGFADLYVSNLYQDNLLYHNNGDLTFTESATAAGVTKPNASFAAWFFDYDNDGWMDLFVTSYYMSVEEVAKSRLGEPVNGETMKLFRNTGNGKFEDVTARVGLDKILMPMGGNFGDIDNDGYLDLYLGSGNPSYLANVPYVLLRNDNGVNFQDITASSGTGELHKGHGVAFADIANNGQEDILTIVGGAVPSDAHRMRFFKNPGNTNAWISVHLVGEKSNRSAIGARIKVTLEDERGKRRNIYRAVGSGGSFGASPLRQHIGLGKAPKKISLDIEWPVTKKHQVFNDLRTDQFIEIHEGSSAVKVIDLKQAQQQAVQR
jgi:hypothetical protein